MACLVIFSCEKVKQTQTPAPLNVTNIISTDKEQMYLNYGENYKQFETLILLNNYLDEEYSGIAEVVNIFQTVVEDSTSIDTYVHKFQHFANGVSTSESIEGFWIEDCPLSDTLTIMPYERALELIQQVNLPKPHSKHVCLRNPLGPIVVNPQWVFGNTHSQIWVDAVNGDIKESNPAFPDSFKMPLGEWP